MSRLFLALFLFLFFGQAFANQGIETFPSEKFECTYHFINIAPDEYLILDVIRSEKNSIRFFHIKNGSLIESYLNPDSQKSFKLLNSGNEIIGDSTDLKFKIDFNVIEMGNRVPKVNPFNFLDLSLQDSPEVLYEGGLSFKGQNYALNQSRNFGTISHHFGLKLPGYFYFNTLKNFSSGEQIVGAISLMPTNLGTTIKTFYLQLTSGHQVQLFDLLNSKYDFRELSKTEWDLKIFQDGKEISFHIKTDGNCFAHQIDGIPSKTCFNSQISVGTGQAIPAIIETR